MSSENEPAPNEEPKEDLDAFLIEVESKLRAPFSSLDLAKAVSATTLRQSSPQRYLELVAKVLPRMDKTIQLRVLGLLGLEPSNETNEVVYRDILSQEQEADHEEWVRVVAGLVRGIMFYDPESGGDHRCRGDEARALLKTTCDGIVKRVQANEAETDNDDISDLDPLFVPYRFSLLDTKLLEQVVPQCQSNPHFQVNKDAEILSVDRKMENAKAQEEQREQAQKMSRMAAAQLSASKPVATTKTEVASAAANKAASRPATATGRARPAPPKSSMFLKSKKPTMGAHGRLGRQLANMRKNPVHTRKPGSAQALVAKGRRPGGVSGTAASLGRNTTSTVGSAARAMKYGNNKSKMKMIDVTEVQGLTREHKERDDKQTQEQKMSARKRKILEKAKGIKKAKTNDLPATPQPMSANSVPEATSPKPTTATQSGGALAAAALLAYQQQTRSSAQASSGSTGALTQNSGGAKTSQTPSSAAPSVNMPHPPAVAPATGTAPPKQDWRQLLEKSNKLSAEDRFRVKQFFVDRFNPTPDVPVYKMKLHEEKTADPSGQIVKETLYLELDYNTFGFKKLRKTKKK